MSNDQSNIIVSICCITYNHAPFIRKALDGFLMQQAPSCVPQGSKMSDWCEILIHDDCSTDGTTEIVKEYAAKYPDLIFPLYEEENQYSKGVKVDFFNYNRAKGKYIAYCEGDDYWTDPNKLQKQVDFMESHPEYSLCFHDFSLYDSRTGEVYESRDSHSFKMTEDKSAFGIEISVVDYFYKYGQPLTMLFRISMFDFNWHNQYKYYRDTHEIYHLLKAGKGYWMNFNGGVYVKHNGGIYTSGSLTQHMLGAIECVEELYIHNKDDKELRAYLKEILLWNHDVYKRERKANEFNKIIKPLWRVIPFVIVNVYWVIIKRILKSMISDVNIRNDIFR